MELHADLKAITNELTDAVDALAATSNGVADGNRQKIADAAKKILSAVQQPETRWMEHLVELGEIGAVHIFQVWEAFALIPDGEGGVSYAELAEKLDADVSMIERIGGVLTSLGILKAVGPDRVEHTPKSRFLVHTNQIGLMHQLMWDNAMVPFFHLESYFKTYGRKEPQTLNHQPCSFALGHPDKPFFEVLGMDKKHLERFIIGMRVVESGNPASGIYDFSWLVDKAKSTPAERPVFVDVGGGQGQALLSIQEEFPELPIDRFVLEDLPETIEAVKRADIPRLKEVAKVPINFHAEQPIKGALVYFIRRCLHNYSDTLVSNILTILAGAMADDSKILIQEDIKTTPPDKRTASLDFLMMMYGGKERTRECWDSVVAKAGLRIVKVSTAQGAWGALSTIECVKA